LQLDLALRRRSLAADMAALCSFEAMNLWSETLKASLLRCPPPGYAPISYKQLRDADQEVWRQTAAACRAGCKARSPGSKSAFESAFVSACSDFEVRLLLAPLPLGSRGFSSSSAASSSQPPPAQPARDQTMQNLQRQVQSLQGQLEGMKRKAGGQPDSRQPPPRKDKSKRQRGRFQLPDELKGKATKTARGEPICFAYNLSGCSGAVPGQKCSKGYHVCAEPGCGKAHCLKDHR